MEKSWKIVLSDSENAKIMAEKIKNKNLMSLDFTCYKLDAGFDHLFVWQGNEFSFISETGEDRY